MNTPSLAQHEQIKRWRDAAQEGTINPWPLTRPAWVERVEINFYPDGPSGADEALVDYFGKEHVSGEYRSRINMCFLVSLDPKSEEYQQVFYQDHGPRVELWPDLNESLDPDAAMCAAAVLRAASVEIIKHKEEIK